MRRTLGLLLLCAAALAPIAHAASPNVVISQVYGGGGNSGAVYKNDFIELFNRGTAAVSLTGWSVQYGSSAGTTWIVTPLSGSIGAGEYYLVQQAAGAGGTTVLPAPDATGSIAMSATAAKVALVASTAPLVGSCPAGAVDLVGFGAANCSEGTPTPTLTNTTAAFRKNDGCTDTDSNSADFLIAAPAPRNSGTTPKSCGVTNAAPAINAPANPAAAVFIDAAPFTVGLTGSDDGGVYVWTATPGNGISSVAVTNGQGTANVTYTVTSQTGFIGTATFTASLSDNVNPAATRAVNIQVNPNVANNAPQIFAPANPIATVAQDAAPFTVTVFGADDNGVFNWSGIAGTGVASAVISAGQGTNSATFTVTLQAGFSGTATFTANLSDNFNAAVTQAVNVAVTPAPPPPLDHLVVSQVYGGGGNASATYRNDYVEIYNPTTSAVDVGGWTIQYASSTGTTWQAQPLGGVIGPGEYYLVSLASGGAVGATLPLANVNGSINISGTTGKIALVAGGDALSGACPLSDVVDLVGYGTANCREGSTNAPSPSNTIAIFRKNGGFTDTNVNGSDFVTGAPNPRRTTPIQEIGPYVLNVDPRNNNTVAPRDASLTITFTEDVEISAGAWFGISCATTGLHNDATVAGSGRTWIVTPNVNFVAGETCTATIYKDFIRDTDFDDSLPGSDLLNANYTWSFTVATGSAPAYSTEVHLTMGNPSDAVASVSVPDNFLMEKPELTISYNRDRGTPNWVSWHLADEWVGTLERFDTFRPDPQVPADWYRVTHLDYTASGFDRGHMVPNADRDKETSAPINQATFLMTNMIPQTPDNNQGPWANMENYLRTLLPANELYVVAGGAGTGGQGSNGFTTTIANGKVTVPAQTWKVVLVLPKAGGDDVSRVTAGARTISVVMPNIQGIRNIDWQSYLTTVDAVEALTGYDFFENVSDMIENAIEAGTNGANPPGVENQSFSTDEDASKSFTIAAANPGSGELTYTIVSGPSHGTLSGSGAAQTYTPAPDYFGSDSFTFRVSSGSLTSTLATMSITVYDVNDAPSVSLSAPSAAVEGSTVTASVAASDVDGDGLTYTWTVTKNGAPFATTASFTPDDNGTYVVSVAVSDGTASVSDAKTIAVSNVDPVIAGVSGPTTSQSVGTAATVSISFSDAGAADTHTATFAWGDGTTSAAACTAGVCSATNTYAAAGIYTVAITLADDDGGNAATSFQPVIVTDANAGFVSSGGWIDTPAGKGTFVANARYQKDGLAGNARFDLSSSTFVATTFEWLVVSGNTATMKGTGTIDGAGTFAFVVTVNDATPDKFGIRIWNPATLQVVYDTTPQILGGGAVTIHTK
ncbi:MAG TPA: DNA/RNA non-specific endonuclease [Thermoanaerobaculia bacterium]|nr:DNA/RNA non-specific endonuclease [Thermoanaerobaculia bacterium]